MNKSELNTIVATGENYKIEFKENIDKTFVEEAVAFANASGGKILMGITDRGEIKGIDTSNSSRSRVQDTLMGIKPTIGISIEIVENVMVIEVPEGRNKPYACSKGFFLRVGANSQKLDRDDIMEFFQSEGRIRFDEIINRDLEVDSVLNKSAYDNFIRLAGISNVLDPVSVLENLNCGQTDDERFRLNNAGILFFSDNPIRHISHASVVCALYKGKDKVIILDKKDLSGSILQMIDDGILFLKKHLNLSYEIEGLRRKEILELPEVALREAVTNAVCHRDYFEKGAQVMIEIFDDRVVISNPGGLPKGLEVKNFGKISMARNPVIASLLEKCDYIEKMGTGIQRMRIAMAEKHLPEPEFDFEGFFIVTLYRNSKQVRQGIEKDRDHEDLGIEGRILELMMADSGVTISGMSEKLNRSTRTVERHLKKLREDGFVVREGSKSSGKWVVKATLADENE
ncbi:helix-turn-helix domain-containing protein [Acidaminobacter sp.]|uniref:AlbA family DNA-binding domain-containing protein n=1 Tax=Acidaminobacter sp. TaxID=1872102 RepID=UPI002564559D|nr:helix-turn-helix domain-containing protein [Acidaminobacter sp.]MDK9712027.1 helix-turn-helix domain-containing protein [Acidaminobacter sp.]